MVILDRLIYNLQMGLKKKTLGIIGGIAPESTIEYYRLIVDSYRERNPDGSYPLLLINSIDMKQMLDMIAAKDLERVVDYLVGEVKKLAVAGADFGFLASNTPHIVFDKIQERSPIPLVSIVEAACEAAKEQKIQKLGLFGTRFTMQGKFYSNIFSREGMVIVLPEPDEQEYIHEKYMGELVKGIFLPETRERLLEITDRLKKNAGIEALILGGTELPLILREQYARGIPFLDTTRIHVSRVMEQYFS
mgnify:CR=1 FL=1